MKEEVKNGVLKRRSRLCLSNVDSSSNSSFPASRNLDFDSASNTSTATSTTTMDENNQVPGTTTRRQWSDWVSRPKSAASLSAWDGEESENVSQATSRLVCVCLSQNDCLLQEQCVLAFSIFFSLSSGQELLCEYKWFLEIWSC